MKEKEEIGQGLEELLVELRNKHNWSRVEVLDKLNVDNLTEKNIKKWEYGLEYPDLDMIYRLSEIYQVSSSEIIQAKNNSYAKGVGGINKNAIKCIAYILNVSLYAGTVIMALIYIIVLVGAFLFFLSMANAF